jgi:osmoprotectant transport system ATP-binding protein
MMMAGTGPSASTPLDAPAITLERVSKAFDNGRHVALRQIEVAVRPGSFVALVGGSGAGKTTLLKCVNRLLEVDEGVVRVQGRPVGELPPHILRRRIGYVFQAIGLFPHMTVGENIAITPRLLGWSEPERTARAAELLDLVQMPRDFADRRPADLSGGQQQRIGVARALAAGPAIMLLDEPFGALDPVTRDALGRDYRQLHDRLGLTTVMVTHDVVEAVLLADRILVMRDGGIVADDTPRALMGDHPDPHVRELMAMPRRQAARVQALLGGPTP